MQHDAAKPGKFIIGLPVPAASAVLVSLVAAQPSARRLVRRRRPAGARRPRRHPVVPHGQPHPLPLVQGSAPVAAHHHRLSRHRRLHRRGADRRACTRRSSSSCSWRSTSASALTEEVFFYRRRREEERAAKEPQMVLEADGGAKNDEEVLEELGAYDGDEDERARACARAPDARQHHQRRRSPRSRALPLGAARRGPRHQDRGAARPAGLLRAAGAARGRRRDRAGAGLLPRGDRDPRRSPSTAASPTCRGRSTSSTSSAARATSPRTSTTSSPSGRARSGCSSGIRDDEAAERFAAAGILVVQERCLMVDWQHYAGALAPLARQSARQT